MNEHRGIAASPGIVVGTAFVYSQDMPAIPQYSINAEDLEDELQRLSFAVEKAIDDLEEMRTQALESSGNDEASLLNSHLLMLRDPAFFDSIKQRISNQLENIEWILHQSVREMTEKLASSSDPYLRERTADIHDVSKRVLGHLLEHERTSLADLSEPVVLVAHDLLPSDAVAMNKRMVMAIVTDAGGKTSHTAIIARSFEIPAVLGLSSISKEVQTGDTVIVDGNHGNVISDPDQETTETYERLKARWEEHEVRLLRLNRLAAETPDGKLIWLKGNIEVPEEVDAVISHGADGIGLYRSEFLFLKPGALPSEEEQYEAYRSVLEAMEGRPVTIRTLDVGGDKVSSEFAFGSERNPILGWRAIRFCLSQHHVFRTQLRALLRASVHGKLRIMFPMISGAAELNRAYRHLEDVRQELRSQEIPFDETIPVGIMVEVPSAAMTSDVLARKADFFSIGTNDLIQYTIAVDRGNERVAYLYQPFHPGVLRLIKLTIDNAHREGISVAMCGEMAGDPYAAVVLLGLGLDEFSMSSAGIPEVKRIIRSTSIAEAEELAGRVMEMRSSDEIWSVVEEYMSKRFELELV